jgi:hypothetical protein
MFNPSRTKWLVACGILAASLGVFLSFQLGSVADSFLGTSVILSFAVTLLGELAALIGGTIWASKAPLVQVFVAGLSLACLASLLIPVTNVHNTPILVFAVLMAFLGAAILLIKGAGRWFSSSGQRQH